MNKLIELKENEIIDIKIGNKTFKNCQMYNCALEEKVINLDADRWSNAVPPKATATISRDFKFHFYIKEIVYQKYIGEDME
jgi:hypothetical protein